MNVRRSELQRYLEAIQGLLRVESVSETDAVTDRAFAEKVVKDLSILIEHGEGCDEDWIERVEYNERIADLNGALKGKTILIESLQATVKAAEVWMQRRRETSVPTMEIGEPVVLVKAADVEARIVEVRISKAGVSYEVSYWLDGKKHSAVVSPDELRSSDVLPWRSEG